MQNIVNATFPGGSTTTLMLSSGFSNFQIEFRGRNSGAITVKARGQGGDQFGTIENGTITLGQHHTMTVMNCFADELQFNDAGTGAYSVIVKQWGRL